MITVFEAIAETELQPGESPYAVMGNEAPTVGSRVAMQNIEPATDLSRRWTVVAVDEYQAGEELLYVAYCAVDEQSVGDRAQWYGVQSFQRRPQTHLRLFFGGTEFLTMEWNFTQTKPTAGEILPEFNIAAHTVRPLPWQVSTVQSYLLKGAIAHPCYAAVHVASCLYLPELAVA